MQKILTLENVVLESQQEIVKLTEHAAEAQAKAKTIIAMLRRQLGEEHGNNKKHTANMERQLTEYTDTIARLEHDIAVEKNARAEADSTIASLTAERQREYTFKERMTNVQRELTECNDINTLLEQDLAKEKEARARADASLAEFTSERERERRELVDRAATAERECNETITVLERKLAIECEARARADAALTSNLERERTELSTAREDASRALSDVRQLRADARVSLYTTLSVMLFVQSSTLEQLYKRTNQYATNYFIFK